MPYAEQFLLETCEGTEDTAAESDIPDAAKRWPDPSHILQEQPPSTTYCTCKNLINHPIQIYLHTYIWVTSKTAFSQPLKVHKGATGSTIPISQVGPTYTTLKKKKL